MNRKVDNTALLVLFLTLLARLYLPLQATANSVSENGPKILLIRDDMNTTSALFDNYLNSLGYRFSEIQPDLITPQIVGDHELTILCTGSNIEPCRNSFMRNILISHANSGGKVMIEGGQTGYIGAVYPGYAAFSNKVLRISGWVAHSSSYIELTPQFEHSTIVNFPNKLPFAIDIIESQFNFQDMCSRMENSYCLYRTPPSWNTAGIIIFPDAESPQIVNLCFSLDAIEPQIAKNIVTNVIYAMVGDPVGIYQTSDIVPAEFGITNTFPNPFNLTSAVSFKLHKRITASMNLYSVDGKLVRQLFVRELPPGEHRYNLVMEGISSGMYFILLQAEKFSDVRAVCLLK